MAAGEPELNEKKVVEPLENATPGNIVSLKVWLENISR